MNYKVTGAELTSIANAIRTKGQTSSPLTFPAGFVSAIGAIPSGGGGVNVIVGGNIPTQSIGSNGDIYLQCEGWVCDEAYLVTSTSQRLATHSTEFYKLYEGPAIAVHYKFSQYYGPLLVSTNAQYVLYTKNNTPLGSTVIDGVTWYLSKGEYWSPSTDNPTIPTLYDAGIVLNNANIDSIVRLIHEASNMRYTGIGAVASAYIKQSNEWVNLIGAVV